MTGLPAFLYLLTPIESFRSNPEPEIIPYLLVNFEYYQLLQSNQVELAVTESFLSYQYHMDIFQDIYSEYLETNQDATIEGLVAQTELFEQFEEQLTERLDYSDE